MSRISARFSLLGVRTLDWLLMPGIFALTESSVSENIRFQKGRWRLAVQATG